jgi:hypothetical protein
MRCAVKQREIGMAVKLHVTFHPQDVLKLLIIDALQVPDPSEQIPVEFADNASFSPDLEVFSFDSSLPPPLSYPPSFKRLSYPFSPPSIEKGDWIMLDALHNLQSYSFSK